MRYSDVSLYGTRRLATTHTELVRKLAEEYAAKVSAALLISIQCTEPLRHIARHKFPIRILAGNFLANRTCVRRPSM